MKNDFELYYTAGMMLRQIRQDRKMTLEYVSEKMNCTLATIQRYESGERKFKIELLQEILNIYHIDYYDFVAEMQDRAYGTKTYKGDNKLLLKLKLLDDVEKRAVYTLIDFFISE
ncbi:unnamed protein product, partial [marine sediment metagenome]